MPNKALNKCLKFFRFNHLNLLENFYNVFSAGASFLSRSCLFGCSVLKKKLCMNRVQSELVVQKFGAATT